MFDRLYTFRKKYTLALLLFVAGTTQAFYFHWEASSYTAFAALLLGIFGSADLIDKAVGKMPQK
jgi:hypothetical protein